MYTFIKETYYLCKINWKNMLVFELVYRLTTGAMLLEALNYGLTYSLHKAGYSYLTMENLGDFLLKPYTILVMLGISVFLILCIMIEAGSLLCAYSSTLASVQLNVADMLADGIQSAFKELKRKNMKLFGIIMIQFTLINSSFVFRVCTHVKPFNFVLKEILEKPSGRGILLVNIGVLMAIAIPSVFVIHGCMLEDKSFTDSMKQSKEMLKGSYWKKIVRLLAIQILLILLIIIGYFIFVVLMASIAVLFVERNMEFVFLIEACRKMEWILLFLGALAANMFHFAAVTIQYYPSHETKHYKGHIINQKSITIMLVLGIMLGGWCLFDTIYNGNRIVKSAVAETEITAHRGSSQTAPENTMAALEAAIEERADRIEIDVQESLDGYIVVHHDVLLKRVTGVNKKVSDLTWEELSQLDAGSWFSPEYAGEPIASLEQIMECAKGKIDLNIEIKNLGADSQIPQKVLNLVNQYGMQEQCVITSTNLGYLQWLKKEQPEIKTGYILSAAYGEYYSNDAIDFISIRSSFVSRHMIERCHEEGKAVHVWTVNTKPELERLKTLGVDSIITDYPILAREILYREDATESLLEYLRLLLR